MLVSGKAIALVVSLVLSGGYGASVLMADAPEPQYVDPVDEALDACADGRACDHVAIGLMVRWGFLPSPEEEVDGDARVPDEVDVGEEPVQDPSHDGPPMIPWDGFVEVTRGGVKAVRTLLFETGGEYRWGGDDTLYPRNNRLTVEWRSSTTVHWDGVLLLLVVPKMDDPMPHVTLHTEPWSHVFEAAQLLGLHVRIPVTPLGHEIEINGFPVERDGDRNDVAVIRMMVRWGYLPQPEGAAPEAADVPEEEKYAMVPWDGFLQTTKGGIKLLETLLFETGGAYENGGDDFVYPRNNRLTLEWRSSTTTHWDGIVAAIVVPVHAVPEAHVTLHTEQWSHVFMARHLVGLHARIQTDDLGHEIEINGKLVTRDRPGEDDGFRLMAKVIAADEDGAFNDVVLRATLDREPLAGVAVYLNEALAGETNDDGVLLVKDLTPGEYAAAATHGDQSAATTFEVGE